MGKTNYIDDYINKEAVLDLIADYDLSMGQVVRGIHALPSITSQESRKGHWIKGYTFPDGAYWKCDKCNELIKVKIPMRYCNNCGAKMVEPQEGEGCTK